MATYSCILAWKIPWTEKPGGLQSIDWQRVGYDWALTYIAYNLYIDVFLKVILMNHAQKFRKWNAQL